MQLEHRSSSQLVVIVVVSIDFMLLLYVSHADIRFRYDRMGIGLCDSSLSHTYKIYIL